MKRRRLAWCLLLVLGKPSHLQAAAPVAATSKQYIVRLKLKECDPKAKGGKAAAKTITEPTVSTVFDRSCWFACGGEVKLAGKLQEVGTKCELHLSAGDVGCVRVDVKCEESSLVRRTEGEPFIRKQQFREELKVSIGDKETIDLPPTENGNLRWLELVVEPAEAR